MNQGELIQTVRLLDRTVRVQEERIATLEKMVHEIKEIMKSPIRRAVHATRQEP